MAEADVEFSVTCRDTQLGELVYVVGSHEAIGSWSAERAIPLTTTASTFPRWSSPHIPLPAGINIEFKFLVNTADRKGTARWEAFPGNRKLRTDSDKIINMDTAWGDVKVAVSSCNRPAGPTASSVLAEQLQDRDMMRRNFSQSLMALDVSKGARDEEHLSPVNEPDLDQVSDSPSFGIAELLASLDEDAGAQEKTVNGAGQGNKAEMAARLKKEAQKSEEKRGSRFTFVKLCRLCRLLF